MATKKTTTKRKTATKKTAAKKTAPKKATVKKTVRKTTKAVATRKKAAKKTTRKVAKKVTRKTTAAKKAVRKSPTMKKARRTAKKTEKTIFDMYNTDKMEDMAKQIWLAGLGAYSQSFEDLQSRVEEINEKGQKRFDTLVAKGAKVQAKVEKKAEARRDSVEDKIVSLKDRLSSNYLENLSEKIALVSDKLDDLSRNIKKRA